MYVRTCNYNIYNTACIEILNFNSCYLNNAWSFLHAIVHKSVLYVLAEFPTILDSFFTNTTSDLYNIMWGGCLGMVGSHKVVGYTMC